MATSKITSDSIQDNAITSQNIQDNAISDSKLASTLDLTGKSISMTDLNLDAGYGSTAPVYGVRAWVNFDGTTNTGGNCTIRASANVSSVADNGTGDYTVNFTSAMPDVNYCAVLSTSSEGNGNWRVIMQWNQSVARTTSAIRMGSSGTDYSQSPAGTDFSYVDVAIFR